jgi:hypothetical protein
MCCAEQPIVVQFTEYEYLAEDPEIDFEGCQYPSCLVVCRGREKRRRGGRERREGGGREVGGEEGEEGRSGEERRGEERRERAGRKEGGILNGY